MDVARAQGTEEGERCEGGGGEWLSPVSIILLNLFGGVSLFFFFSFCFVGSLFFFFCYLLGLVRKKKLFALFFSLFTYL